MTTKTDEQERRVFEAACIKCAQEAGYETNPNLERAGEGYANSHTNSAWWGYQAARAALQSQKPKTNDLMLSAVIRMPLDMAMADPISRMQFYQRAQQALNELEALQSQDREDAERYRWLRDTLHGAKAGGGVEVNDALQVYETPVPGEEVRVYWYQDTPVGFYDVQGTTLDEAIDHARRVEGEGE